MNKKTWKAGTVSSNLSSYIPKYLHSLLFSKAWEASVCEVYQRYGSKLTELDCQKRYVDLLKKLPSYGSTYFPVTYHPAELTLSKQMFQGDIIMGINAIGIHLIDVHQCKRQPNKATLTFPFQRIISWDCDKLTFFFEYHKLKSDNKSSLFTFSTPHATLIRDLMYDWLDAFKDFAVENQSRYSKKEEPKKKEENKKDSKKKDKDEKKKDKKK